MSSRKARTKADQSLESGRQAVEDKLLRDPYLAIRNPSYVCDAAGTPYMFGCGSFGVGCGC
jgi:hypothetical protein